MEAELSNAGGMPTGQRIKQDVSVGKYLRATVFVIGLGFFVQITGINAVVYFGPQIFESMGVESDLAKLGLSALVQLFALLAVFGSMLLVDRARTPARCCSPVSASWSPANLLLIATFRGGTEDGATITLGGTLTFVAFIGLAVLRRRLHVGLRCPRVGIRRRELSGPELRSLGASAMLTANLTANFIVGLVSLSCWRPGAAAGTFMFFGVMAIARLPLRLQDGPRDQGSPIGRHPPLLGERRHWPEEDTTTESAA